MKKSASELPSESCKTQKPGADKKDGHHLTIGTNTGDFLIVYVRPSKQADQTTLRMDAPIHFL